jgi:2-polyprenyl-6-methoxyphenol hydroxylase-like FAD-dependent oxidoreductase
VNEGVVAGDGKQYCRIEENDLSSNGNQCLNCLSQLRGQAQIMSSEPAFDVAIVGGSISGCTAATFFARLGLRVAVLERSTDPHAYKKVCTHYIQPCALPTLERLGLAERIEAAGGVRNGVDLWTRWGWTRFGLDARFPQHGYNFRREKLDPMVRAMAAETPGVTFLPGHNVTGAIVEGERVAGVEVKLASGETTQVRARLVVGADGRRSKMGDLAGVSAVERPNSRFMYFAYFKNLPLASGQRSMIWHLDPDAAYAFPNDDGLTLAMAGPVKDKLPEFKKDTEGAFLRFFQSVPQAPDFSKSQRVSEFLGMLDMPQSSRPAAARGMAFIGDAALTSDPLWGVGCGWAFMSAEWLVDSTGDDLARRGKLAAALERYRVRHKKALGLHQFMINDYATGRLFNPIERLMFSAATKDQKLAHHLHAYAARVISPLRLQSPPKLARAAWVNLIRKEGLQRI